MADDAQNEAGNGGDAPLDGGVPTTTVNPAPAKVTLEDSLASLDDATRAFVLGEVHKARNEAQGLRTRLKEAEPKVQAYDALDEASRTDLEKAQAEAIAANRRADELVSRAVKAEIRAAAADSFADPTDAARFLDGDYTTDDGGIDTERIAADINNLLTQKPHLRKHRGPAFDAAQGTSAQGAASPGQLSRTDIERLYRAHQYDAIEKARQEGRLTSLLGGKQ